MIVCRDIRKNYGRIAVLKGVSLSVPKGETFAIIGPNGAGKTTFFKVVTGETKADSGAVLFEGADITALKASERVRLGFGRTFQVARIFVGNTVLENLVIAVEAQRRNRGERPPARLAPAPDVVDEAAALARRLSLGERLREPASFLSHGDRKRLEFGLTLALLPRVLLMDEPTAGMAPAERRATVDIIRRLREEDGLTIVLTEHDMDVVAELSDRVLVLNYGETVAMGSMQEIRASAAVRELYLGDEAADA